MSGKYVALQEAVFSIFAKDEWKAEGIKTYPSNFIPVVTSDTFLRVSIIPSGSSVNQSSTSGLLMVDIFTPAGVGLTNASNILDALDRYLNRKAISTDKGLLQFNYSSAEHKGVDSVNSSLYRSLYSIPFNFFGVIN